MKTIKLSFLIVLLFAFQLQLCEAAVTTFDNGNEGWGVVFANNGAVGDFLETSGGNPGAHLSSVRLERFGISFHNKTNPSFLGDYHRFGTPLMIQIDVKVEFLNFFGTPVGRNLILELVNYNPPGSVFPYVSVWYNLGEISAAKTGSWTNFSVMIDDPGSASLPSGWGGFGAEDPNGESILPSDRTFASVLQNVDEIRFTTYEPGFAYGFTDFHIRYDNPSLIAVGSSGDFAGWIAGFGLDPSDQGFGDDPDGDGIPNGVEAWFGTHPGSANAGLTRLAKTGNVFSFQHPRADPPLTDVTGSYQWSLDLATWYPDITTTVGDTTVTIIPVTESGTTTVTADTTGSVTTPDKLFLRAVATQN